MTGNEWAAWVQAIGSILGIGIAIAVPWWQTRLAREDQRAEYEKRASALHLVLWPEILLLHHTLTDLRASLRARKPKDLPELRTVLSRCHLPPTPHHFAHIHDGVYFDTKTCRAYHNLVSTLQDYNNERDDYLNAREGERTLWGRKPEEIPALLAGRLDYVDLLLNEAIKIFGEKHAATMPKLKELLIRPDPE